jgi:glycerophosphoryl diester phosphodiesterase
MLSPLYLKAQVKIIAHRGASYLAPENTVASALLAWELNADAVEVDIYLTKDNKIVCIHDATTKRTTGSNYRVSETESSILRSLDAGSFKDLKYKDEKIPFLTEVIKTVPEGKELVVEIKCGPEILPYLRKTISNNNNTNYSFICFDLNTITETRKLFPEHPCYWLCSNKELLDKNLESIPATGLDGISLSFNLIDAGLMKKAESLGLEVYTWTVDNPSEAKRLYGLGVKGITTNRPGWLEKEAGISK